MVRLKLCEGMLYHLDGIFPSFRRMRKYARENGANRATFDRSPIYAQGAFKNVFRGRYTEGRRRGKACVVKSFIAGSVFESSYFANELKIVDKALEIVTKFNDAEFINKTIWVNIPTIWTVEETDEMVLIEPMIINFEKFNSNTGWTPRETNSWIHVMQALSHFSYHITGGQMVICDLQGGVYMDGFAITDPVILSRHGNYGPTDLGADGISSFFARHVCNSFCRDHWASPRQPIPHFRCQRGSAMIVPTRRSRPPLTGISRFQSDY